MPILKLPRSGKTCQRNLIKFRKQKLRGTFRKQSHVQNRAFTKLDNGIYSFYKIELHLRHSKGLLSKMVYESDNKVLFIQGT